MAETISAYPTSYSLDSYLMKVSDAGRMYNYIRTSNGNTYGIINIPINSTNSAWLRGFDFSTIPHNAIILSAEGWIDALSSSNSNASVWMDLYTGGGYKRSGASVMTYRQVVSTPSFIGANISASQLSNICIGLCSTRTSPIRFDVFGATITVTYEIPKPYYTVVGGVLVPCTHTAVIGGVLTDIEQHPVVGGVIR